MLKTRPHTFSLSLFLTLTLFQSVIQLLSTFWTTFVFISMLKTRCLLMKIAMLFLGHNSLTRATDIRVHIAGSQLKMFESQTSAGNQSSCQVVKFDSWDMLNNVCFHVYTQKCQVVRLLGCQVVRLLGCQVVRLSGCQVWFLGHAEQLLFSCLW